MAFYKVALVRVLALQAKVTYFCHIQCSNAWLQSRMLLGTHPDLLREEFPELPGSAIAAAAAADEDQLLKPLSELDT